MLRQWYKRFRIVLAFSCGRAKMIQKRYVSTQFFLKTETKNSFSNENGYVLTGPYSEVSPIHESDLIIHLTFPSTAFKP